MEIISRGTGMADIKYIAKCPSCESVIRVDEGELKFTKHRNDSINYITCPVCDNTVYSLDKEVVDSNAFVWSKRG